MRSEPFVQRDKGKRGDETGQEQEDFSRGASLKQVLAKLASPWRACSALGRGRQA